MLVSKCGYCKQYFTCTGRDCLSSSGNKLLDCECDKCYLQHEDASYPIDDSVCKTKYITKEEAVAYLIVR